MEYRGFIIRETGYSKFPVSFSRQDGDVAHTASSIQDAKREIDMMIFEHTIYEVEFCGLTHFFQWLTDAVSFANRTNGKLRKSV
jgi:hypothetical protein